MNMFLVESIIPMAYGHAEIGVQLLELVSKNVWEAQLPDHHHFV